MNARDIAEKPAQFQQSAVDQVLVAEQNGAVCGVTGLRALPLFHQPGKLGRITALVVDSAFRGQFIGQKLISRAEEWFREKNCKKIEVTSGDH